MQVNSKAEQDSYAIVGGETPKAFKISASAHAFRILSNTLYRDKPRAVVREILCNAIDAHVMAGIGDRPVEVTLTDSELIIQDFGPGIPDSRIVDIYATYFGSTKTDDAGQTGGFGLGSKAPFAYTDHFTVTSCFGGVRSVYALHVNSDELDGAPAVRRMVTTPCVGTGVIVSVPVASEDKMNFVHVVRSVASEGGMNVIFNGDPLKVTDYRAIRQAGYGLVREGDGDTHVLYANVLYPLESNPAIDTLREAIRHFIPPGYSFILAMPPSTIAVTPSRESLSYDEMTLKAIARALKLAVHQLEAVKWKTQRAVLKGVMSQTKRHEIASIAKRDNAFPLPRTAAGARDIGTLNAQYAVRSLRGGRGKIIARDLAQAATGHFRDHTKSLNLLARQGRGSLFYDQFVYLRRRALRVALAAGAVDKLFVRLADHEHPQRIRQVDTLYQTLNPTIVVAPSLSAAAVHTETCFIISLAKPNEKQMSLIMEHAKRQGFEVVVIEPRPKAPKKLKAVSTVPLYRPFDKTRRYYTGTASLQFAVPALATPQSYVSIAARGQGCPHAIRSGIGSFSEQLPQDIATLFPDVAVACNIKERDQLVKAGVPRLGRLLLDRLKAQLALKKPREHLWAAMPQIRYRCWSDSDHKLRTALIAAAKTGPRVICELFEEKWVEDKDALDSIHLWDVATRVFETEGSVFDGSDTADITSCRAENKEFTDLLAIVRKRVPKARTDLYRQIFLHQAYVRYLNLGAMSPFLLGDVIERASHPSNFEQFRWLLKHARKFPSPPPTTKP